MLQREKLTAMGENIQRVEAQTNHIKDQLMEKTALASHAQGVNDEKIRVAVESNVPIQSVVAGPVVPKP